MIASTSNTSLTQFLKLIVVLTLLWIIFYLFLLARVNSPTYLLYNGTLTIIRGVIVVAKSKAKKAREKLTREGRMNPEEKRSPFVFADMRPRTTKTKKDHLYQIKYKNHQSQTGNDGSFYFAASANRLINDRLLKYKLCA
jgi:hypothetical protein